MPTTLEQAIRNKSARVGVVGLGYVGLPLIRALVTAGFRTLGFDVDERKVACLRAGQSYIGHIDSAWIASCVTEKKFEPTADMRRLAEADAIIICVPTPLTECREPDLSYVRETTRQVASTLRKGQLVVLESTTYPRTTRDVVLPILAETGLRPGEDFFLAYSPEREDPGNPTYTAGTIPKVVGGIDAASGRLAELLYGAVVAKVVPVASAEVAEACKILENTYRAVNIALVNELKMLYDEMGIDVWEVIAAAKTKPFGFQAFYPGPGLGGHCIPIDPFYLTWIARKYGVTTRFIELAGEINAFMPRYVVARVMAALNDHGKPLRGSRVCILGMAYKKDVDDPRESPSFELWDLLAEGGAALSYSDPFVPKLPKMRHHNVPDMASSELTAEFLAAQDCVLVATDHSAFDWDFIVRHSPLIVDTRNATANVGQGREKIRKAEAMPHYLVTGAAGFIGSHVCRLLLDQGDEVTGLDSLNDAYDPRLKQWRLARLQGTPGFRFEQCDISRRDAVDAHFAAAAKASDPPYSAVVNLAARAGVRQSVEEPWPYIETNVTGTLNLLQACVRWDVPKFVLASTSSLYGGHNTVPYREDADTTRPLSPYAASKQAAESLVYSYHHLYKLDVSVLRYFTVYGPAGRPDMSVFRFVRRIAEGEPIVVFGDGRQQRDFTYVEDIARGTVLATRPLGFEVINLGGDRPVELSAIISMIEQLVGRKATINRRPAHPADVAATWADIGKAKRLLDWSPECPIEEGLARCVAWYQQERAVMHTIELAE